MEPQKVQQFARRVRPRVKSFKAIELYGEAVTQTDDKKKAELLKLSLNEDPQFVYASRDLDELEKRMKQYAAISDAAQRSATVQLLQKLKSEKDPLQRYSAFGQLQGQLMMQGRWRTLIAVCRAVAADPPVVPSINVGEQAQMQIVKAYEMLHDDDGVLREGEKFLASYPASMFSQLVQMEMNNAINHKHAVEDGKKSSKEEIAKLPAAEQHDPCKTAQIYNDKQQLADAKRDYLACDARGGVAQWPPGNMSLMLARIALDTGDFALMKKSLARLQHENATLYRTVALWEKYVSDE
jgi:hypothetical protein